MFDIENIRSEYAKSVECLSFNDLVKFVDVYDSNNYCILPRKLEDTLKKIKAFKVYEDDIWIITNPKCGTTWTQELVWLLVHNLNFEQALKTDLDVRVPFIEMEGLMAGGNIPGNEQVKESGARIPRDLGTGIHDLTPKFGIIPEFPIESQMTGMPDIFPSIQVAMNMPRPRIIKTHLPAFLLPDEFWKVKPKIIYVVRNPKDAAVSWFHHHKNFHGWSNGNLEIFISAFVNDRVPYSPFNDHAIKFWEMKKDFNLLFLHFEDMKRDLKSVVSEVAKFLGLSYSSEQYEKLCDHLSFDKMKNNKSANKEHLVKMASMMSGADSNWNFIRKGKVGSYKEELTSEQIELLDSYVKKIDADSTEFKYKFQ